MKNDKNKTLEETVLWFRNAGFDNDLSLFVAGILDIENGIDDIVTRILPSLLAATPSRLDQVLAVIEDLQRQLAHVAKHAAEINSFGDKALKYFDIADSKD